MMNKLFVHIGRHKTGTSSLQRFLHENTAGLAATGFAYPESAIRGHGHHLFASQFTRNNLKHNPEPTREEELLRKSLLNEIATKLQTQNVIISSEAFQNCNPQVIAEIFQSYNPTFVIYLREQAGYLISSYAQAIQATDLTLGIDEFESKRFNAHYDRFLADWVKAVGADRLIIRIFNRDLLYGKDIVKDFLANVLDVKEERWPSFLFHETDQNPSLGRDLIEYKRLLNQYGVEQGKDLYQALRQLATLQSGDNKPELSKRLHLKIEKKYSAGNRLTGEQFFNNNSILRMKTPKQFPAETFPQLSLETIEKLNASLSGLLPQINRIDAEDLAALYRQRKRFFFF